MNENSLLLARRKSTSTHKPTFTQAGAQLKGALSLIFTSDASISASSSASIRAQEQAQGSKFFLFLVLALSLAFACVDFGNEMQHKRKVTCCVWPIKALVPDFLRVSI